MTFFNSLHVDVENHIFTFSAFKDLVTFSGVNKAAYTKFDNENFFGTIFKKYHPNYQTLLFKLINRVDEVPNTDDWNKTDEDIGGTSFWKKHVNNNGWKVVCCVFQTGQLNFSKSFLNEVIFHMKSVLNAEKRGLTDDLKRICGMGYADPDSRIHQAWSAHEKTRGLLGVELSPNEAISMPDEDQSIWEWVSCSEFEGNNAVHELEAYFNDIIGERMEEFEALLQEETLKEIDDEKTFRTWIAFDKRFITVVNYFRYRLLEGERQKIHARMDEIGKELKYVEDLKQKVTQKNTEPFAYEVEKQVLSSYFDRVLFAHFLNLFDKDTEMSKKDRRDLYPAFKAYENCVNSQGKKFDLKKFIGKVNIWCTNEKMINEALQILETEMIREKIDSYAKQPLTPTMAMEHDAMLLEIINLWPKASLTSIHEQLKRAIFQEHKDKLLFGDDPNRSMDSIPLTELTNILFNYAFTALVEHLVSQPTETFGEEYFGANTAEMQKFFSLFSPNTEKAFRNKLQWHFSMIGRYAARPLEEINPETMKHHIQTIQTLFPVNLNIKGIMLKAIKEKHGAEGVKTALRL